MMRSSIGTRVGALATGLGLLLASLTACATQDDKKTLVIGSLPWEESIAVSALWEQILESEGFEVEVKQLDAGPAYQALAAGQIDVFPEQWPNYFKSYIDKYGDDITTVGTWYEGTDINLAVPDYVENVDSIEDLPANADLFNGRVVGIEPGSETMKILDSKVVPGYSLDEFEIDASSTPAMLAALDSAIADKKPIVVTLWRPHWAFTKYPIKALEDPQELFGGTGVIQTAATANLQKENSEAAEFLAKFKLTSEQLGKLELDIQAEGQSTPDKGAKKWIAENQELVNSWLA